MIPEWNPFDKLYFSSGEIVTPDRQMDVHDQAWRSLLTALDDAHRRPASALYNRSGVVSQHGFLPSAGGGALQVNIAQGWGLTYDGPPEPQIIPVVLDATETVTCDANPPGNDRYDLVVVEADNALADYTTRMVRDSSGVISPQSLPQRLDYKAKVSIIKGTAAPVPVCPDPEAGQIAVAVCYLPAGFAGIFGTGGSAIYDARTFLRSRLGGLIEYVAYANAAAGGGANPFHNVTEFVSDDSIKVMAPFQRIGVGQGSTGIWIPRELPISRAAVVATCGNTVNPTRWLTGEMFVAGTPTAGNAFTQWTTLVQNWGVDFLGSAVSIYEWDLDNQISVHVVFLP